MKAEVPLIFLNYKVVFFFFFNGDIGNIMALIQGVLKKQSRACFVLQTVF